MPDTQILDPSAFDVAREFDRQVRTLVERGYPSAARLTPEAFTELLAPLREVVLRHADGMRAPDRSRVPFVLVVTQFLVPAHDAMPRTALRGKPGFVSRDTADIARFTPIKDVELPGGSAYVLLDVDRGSEFCGVRPDDALDTIRLQGRTPLTVDEGIAFVTLFPETLEKNHCYSLSGSRCGDKRVPALWISGGAPKLGWCWAGNPHTWLGSASCGGRDGAPSGGTVSERTVSERTVSHAAAQTAPTG